MISLMITTINPTTAMEKNSKSRKRSADEECRKGAYIGNDENPFYIDTDRVAGMQNETPSKRLKGSFVTDLNVHDVLFGRGPQVHRNPGNMRFRDIIKRKFQEYLVTTRRGVKDQIARTIVQTVQSSGGRFLRKREAQASLHLTGANLSSAQLRQNVGTVEVTNEDQKGVYIEVDNITAVEKVKQALRDCNLESGENKRSADSIHASDYTDSGSSQQQDKGNVTNRLSFGKHVIPVKNGDEVSPINEARYAQSKPIAVSSATKVATTSPVEDIDQIRAALHSNQHSNKASSSTVLEETFKRIAEANLNDSSGWQTEGDYNGSPNISTSNGQTSTLIQELQRSLQSYQQQMRLKEQANRIAQQQLVLIRQQEISNSLLQAHSTQNNSISHSDPIRALVQRLLVSSSSEEDRLQLLVLLQRMNTPSVNSEAERLLQPQQRHYPRGLESLLNSQNYPSSLLSNASGISSTGMSNHSSSTNDLNSVINVLQQRIRDAHVPNDIQQLLHRIESNKIPSPTMSMRSGITSSVALLQQNGYQQRTGSDGLNVFEPILDKNSPESSDESNK